MCRIVPNEVYEVVGCCTRMIDGDDLEIVPGEGLAKCDATCSVISYKDPFEVTQESVPIRPNPLMPTFATK